MELSEDKDQVIAALLESNDCLQEEVSRLRTSSKVLRTVISSLRSSLTSYRKQVELSRYNDEVFKAFCEGEFDTPVAPDSKGGLPKASGVVESVVATTEETSASS